MLREIVDYRRFKRLSAQDRAIVFYAEHSGYYPYFEGIIKKLTDEYGRTLCVGRTIKRSTFNIPNNGTGGVCWAQF
jgi:hypothetical protein